MQTRDYDDYIFSSAILGYRKVSDDGLKINIDQETDGYFNLYSDSISVSYLHSMDTHQINAIHYFEENEHTIFNILLHYLSKKYTNPKLVLGFSHVNILEDQLKEYSYTEYVFINADNKKIVILMLKNNICID
jgi:hypothetical protein